MSHILIWPDVYRCMRDRSTDTSVLSHSLLHPDPVYQHFFISLFLFLFFTNVLITEQRGSNNQCMWRPESLLWKCDLSPNEDSGHLSFNKLYGVYYSWCFCMTDCSVSSLPPDGDFILISKCCFTNLFITFITVLGWFYPSISSHPKDIALWQFFYCPNHYTINFFNYFFIYPRTRH